MKRPSRDNFLDSRRWNTPGGGVPTNEIGGGDTGNSLPGADPFPAENRDRFADRSAGIANVFPDRDRNAIPDRAANINFPPRRNELSNR